MGVHAGAGGQAIGLLHAGFDVAELFETDRHSVMTLQANFGGTRIHTFDIREYSPRSTSAGTPDLLFSRITQFDYRKERDQFPAVLEILGNLSPHAVLLECPDRLLSPPHRLLGYRDFIRARLEESGYVVYDWRRFKLRDFGVPQAGSVAILVAIRAQFSDFYCPPQSSDETAVTLGQLLESSMRDRFSSAAHICGSVRADQAFSKWREKSHNALVPRLVPPSTKRRLSEYDRRAWHAVGIDVTAIASDGYPMDLERDLFAPDGPKLTPAQAALIQGFPPDWRFAGRKTEVYRQIVESSSPSVAEAFGRSIIDALNQDPRAAAAKRAAQDVRKSIQQIDAMDYEKFEYFIADLMERDGYRIIRAGGGSGDGGVDVEAEADLNVLVLVQCKHFQDGGSSLGAEVARALAGAAAFRGGPIVSIIVTNGRFTKPCVEEATENNRVRLVDRDRLKRWAEDGEPLSAVIL
uniref:restriction endonuclease n=1 Tax=Streptomyces sp. ND04-05B TaxID=3028693 RepID=UPI0029C028A1|nr:restriction endonuclease [Streptomyces sp. ND04-05B]